MCYIFMNELALQIKHSPTNYGQGILCLSIGIVQFRIEIVLVTEAGSGSRRKRQARSSIVEAVSCCTFVCVYILVSHCLVQIRVLLFHPCS